MRIKIFGKGERLDVCASILRENKSLGKYSEIVILPIPTSKDGVHINSDGHRIYGESVYEKILELRKGQRK